MHSPWPNLSGPNHRSTPNRARLIAAAVHALLLGPSPQHLQFEWFILLYTAIDACFALAKAVKRPTSAVPHAGRVKWMCYAFDMPTPAWADPASGAAVASLRNATVHEALFMGEPLGFAIHGTGANQNLTLEMQALLCRVVVALLGAESNDHLRDALVIRTEFGRTMNGACERSSSGRATPAARGRKVVRDSRSQT